MTLEELKTRAKTSGFNYSYGPFNTSIKPPHLMAKQTDSNNFGADNKVYSTSNKINLELTTNKKDQNLEYKVENEILYDIFWEKVETYIDDEKVYNVSYFFEI